MKISLLMAALELPWVLLPSSDKLEIAIGKHFLLLGNKQLNMIIEKKKKRKKLSFGESGYLSRYWGLKNFEINFKFKKI